MLGFSKHLPLQIRKRGYRKYFFPFPLTAQFHHHDLAIRTEPNQATDERTMQNSNIASHRTPVPRRSRSGAILSSSSSHGSPPPHSLSKYHLLGFFVHHCTTQSPAPLRFSPGTDQAGTGTGVAQRPHTSNATVHRPSRHHRNRFPTLALSVMAQCTPSYPYPHPHLYPDQRHLRAGGEVFNLYYRLLCLPAYLLAQNLIACTIVPPPGTCRGAKWSGHKREEQQSWKEGRNPRGRIEVAPHRVGF